MADDLNRFDTLQASQCLAHDVQPGFARGDHAHHGVGRQVGQQAGGIGDTRIHHQQDGGARYVGAAGGQGKALGTGAGRGGGGGGDVNLHFLGRLGLGGCVGQVIHRRNSAGAVEQHAGFQGKHAGAGAEGQFGSVHVGARSTDIVTFGIIPATALYGVSSFSVQ